MGNPALIKSLTNVSEGSTNTESMSIEGVANKTISLFATVLVAAAATWFIIPEATTFALLLPAILVGFGLSLFLSFSKKTIPSLYFTYAAVQGLVVSGLSKLFEMQYEGIIGTAVGATLFVAGVVFVSWRAGLIKVTDATMKFMFFALIGYGLFLLVELLTGVFTGGNLYTSSWGWLIALVGAGLASYMLAVDLHTISSAISQKLPKDGEWRAAFGLMVTLIWLYIEILRLIGALRR